MRYEVNICEPIFLGNGDVTPVGSEVYGFHPAGKGGIRVSRIRET